MLIFDIIAYIPHIVSAIHCVLKYVWTVFVLKVPISYPGNALAKPISRKGQWPEKKTKAPTGWAFACDKESHVISQKAAPNHPITGESAGRQIWYKTEAKPKKKGECKATFSANENPNSSDEVFRKIMLDKWQGAKPDDKTTPATVREAAVKGMAFYQMIQCDDGHWAGDYGGPMFLLPGLVTTIYITKIDFPKEKKQAMIDMLMNHQQIDGGWGTHIECASTMFGTVMSYIALRLLGAEKDLPEMAHARKFMMQHGGALYAPSWAKFWMAVLGVYDWDGINSIPAEMFLLPLWSPLHPGKLWCHARMVYLPMCYLYCMRFVPDQVKTDPLIQSLREELYAQPYSGINFDDYRQSCADIDQYSPLNPVMKIAQDFLSYYEFILPYSPLLTYMRKRALAFVIEYIHAEDKQTNYVDIGPVNKSLNMLSVWVDAGGDSSCTAFQRHIPRIDDYLWIAEDGMKMQGYNGSQCWDTSFAVQAMTDGGLVEAFPQCSQKIYKFLRHTQIAKDEENRDKYYRHVSKGGWPFSTAAHGWPISDCTAEGLKGVLALHGLNRADIVTPELRISDRRLCDACDVILSFHNADGGWATYENNRGYRWYEMLNPSEVFGDIMIDYSYVECTSACITALHGFSKAIPGYRRTEVITAMKAGGEFIKSIQRVDGSWYGSWGVCFVYGTWFGIEALVTLGENPITSPAILKAVNFLLKQQNRNGGWGESYLACVNKEYPLDGCSKEYGDGGSGVVQTAWAVLALTAAKCTDRQALARGVQFLRDKQLPSGDWAQEAITGVFNRSCGITYTAYRNVFPIWALGRYASVLEAEQDPVAAE